MLSMKRICFARPYRLMCCVIRLYALLFCCMLIPGAGYSQLDTVKFIREDGWIEGMDNYLGIKLSMSNDIQTFQVHVKDDDYKIDLYPNTTTLARLHFNYRFLSFDMKFAPAFLPGNQDEARKGRTKSFGLSAGLNFRHWFHVFSFSRTKGYYINNSSDFPAYVKGGPYLQIPELVITNYEGMTGYSTNPRFSVKSLTTQTERQLKSAGSFVPQVGYRFYTTDNQEKDATSTQRSDNFEVVAGAGYYHTFVAKEKFYLSVGATPGIGYIFTKLTTRFPNGGGSSLVTHSNNPVFRFDGRSALGYNGRSFFTGFVLHVTGISFEQEGTTAINANYRASYQIFVGVRINAPKKLRDAAAIVDELKR